MIKNARRIIKYQIILMIIALVLGILFCNITADLLNKPAEKIMKLVTGSGLKSLKIDNSEIPKIFYPRLRKSVYFPMYIATRAINISRKVQGEKNGEENLKYFLNHVNWLRDNLKLSTHDDVKYGVWEHNFRYPYGIYKLEVPWRSGMAQGYGISALNKAYEITGDVSYLEHAKYALNAFFIEVENGGVTYKDTENDWWFEEYAGALDGVEPRVLNGAIWAILDVYEFWETTGDQDAQTLFVKGINGIKNRLEQYDTGRWTYYDAIGTIATKHYHGDHIKLTQKLYEITGEKIFLEYNKKWSQYKIPYFIREFLIQKPDYHDIVILGLNVFGVLVLEYFFVGLFFFLKRHRL